MAYSESLAARVESHLKEAPVQFEVKKMMGGLAFMVNGKMCVGIAGDRLMARIDPNSQERALREPGCTPMDFTGKAMRGFVFVAGKVLQQDARLHRWIDLALEFNPLAQRSSKRARRPRK